MRRLIGLPALLLFGSLGACVVGQIGGPAGGDGVDCSGSTVLPGEAPIRRLTRLEYNNTVRDLLGDATAPGSGFAPEEQVLGFNNQARSLGVTQLLAEQYMEASEGLAKTAVTKIATLTGCDPVKLGADACGAQFIESFGKRAFRRPLDDELRARLTGVFKAGLTQTDFSGGVRLVIETALQSPRFLYRVEFGMPDPKPTAIKLDDYEMASRLSYLLWSSMPDDALFKAADANELRTPEQVSAQARRMLADPKAKDAIASFHQQWLLLTKIDAVNKDATIYPTYTTAMRDLWPQETMAFVDDVIFNGKGDLETLLTAPYTMANAGVASYYGVSGGPSGSDFVRMDLDPKQRAGILTQPSILAINAKANQTSPVHRGKFVREQLLCQQLPPPPANLKIIPPMVDPSVTTREKFKEHSDNPTCAACHHLMDPLGFGFEHYDGIGTWRDQDHNLPVDASGEVLESQDVNGKFDGALELAQRLAGSEQVRACVVTQWFRFGYGRAEATEDKCSMQRLNVAFKDGKYNIQELLVALTQTDAFLYRKPVVANQ